jgi:hypothetical protein
MGHLFRRDLSMGEIAAQAQDSRRCCLGNGPVSRAGRPGPNRLGTNPECAGHAAGTDSKLSHKEVP